MRLNDLGFWIKTAFFFLFRSGRSTTVLSFMILTAVVSLIFLSSLSVGVNDAMIRNSVSLYSGHISGFALPASLGRETLMGEGVVNVLKRISIPGILSYKDRLETVTMVGVQPAEEKKSTAIPEKTVQGKYLQDHERAIFLSRPLAERLNINVGDTLLFNPRSGTVPVRLTVSGIYRTGIDQLDQGIAFCPIEALPVETNTWSAAVFLDEGAEAESVIDRYHRELPDSYQFKSWGEMMPDLRQLIDLENVSMGIVTILVFGVVSLGIACAFVIFILKNLREYGVMKAMGVTSSELTLLIVTEVILMNLAAAFIGSLVGILAVFLVNRMGGIDLTAFTSHNRYFAVSGVIYPRLNVYSLCTPPVLAFLCGLGSSIWPALLVARKKAAEILRMV
jgi:lipoprotein-releasing system permease protein